MIRREPNTRCTATVSRSTTVRLRTNQIATPNGTRYSTCSPGAPKATGVTHTVSPKTPIRAVSGRRKVAVKDSVTVT